MVVRERSLLVACVLALAGLTGAVPAAAEEGTEGQDLIGAFARAIAEAPVADGTPEAAPTAITPPVAPAKPAPGPFARIPPDLRPLLRDAVRILGRLVEAGVMALSLGSVLLFGCLTGGLFTAHGLWAIGSRRACHERVLELIGRRPRGTFLLGLLNGALAVLLLVILSNAKVLALLYGAWLIHVALTALEGRALELGSRLVGPRPAPAFPLDVVAGNATLWALFMVPVLGQALLLLYLLQGLGALVWLRVRRAEAAAAVPAPAPSAP